MNLFLKIETRRHYERLNMASKSYQKAWYHLSEIKWPEMTAEDAYEEFGGMYPEFGKIVCIAVGNGGSGNVIVFSEVPNEPLGETIMLNKFSRMISDMLLMSNDGLILVGHKIKKFVIPYINVRCIANEQKILEPLKQYGIKPWELNIIDLWEAWRGGIYNSVQSASIISICNAIGIESPEREIELRDISKFYFSNNKKEAIERICGYCKGEVKLLIRIFDRMKFYNVI